MANNPLLDIVRSYFRSQNTEELVHLYYNIEEMYPGYTPQEYEEAKNAILEELRRRHWYFCPIHNVPLETTTIAGVLYFRCPVGGELYKLRGNRLEPVSSTEIQRLRSIARPEQITPETLIGTGVQRPKRFTYSLGHYEVTKAPCDFEEMLQYAQKVFQKARIEVDWSQIHSIQDLKMLVIDVLSHLPPYAPNYMKEPLMGLLNILRMC